MSELESETLARNLEAQRDLYGEPLGDTFRRILTTFELNQSQLASVIGLSAPMLSQLMAGHRVKIGNPAVLERVRGLEELAADDSARSHTPSQLAERLEGARATGHLARATTRFINRTTPTDAVEIVRNTLREVASGRDLRQAAALLAPHYPSLAEFLLVYGTGDDADARAHYDAVVRGV